MRPQCHSTDLRSIFTSPAAFVQDSAHFADDASGRVPEYAVCYSAGRASILLKKSDVASFDEVKAVVCIGQMSKSAIYFQP